MNWLDLFIVLFLVTALVRGSEVGFIRQFFSTIGFFVGLFLGAWIQGLIIGVASTPNSRALLSLCVTLGLALALMTVGEYVGLMIKFKLRDSDLTNKLDKIFGSVLAAFTLLIAVWLGAAIFRNVPDTGWQRQIRTSRIVAVLDSALPSAPNILTRVGHLIDPNGSPQVFAGLEPAVSTDTPLPNMGELTPAAEAARPSVVKIEGEGCDNVVEGTGFIAAPNEIVTNAHVVAGVKHPYVFDAEGRHSASVVSFDPNLDLAILRVKGLNGKPLALAADEATPNTAAAILGYPADAGFKAQPGVVLETFTAQGRNIYNKGNTMRDVYSVKVDVEHGNSGGPMIDKDARVIGVIFAKSINYDHVGYALTMKEVIKRVSDAKDKTTTVSTDTCAQ